MSFKITVIKFLSQLSETKIFRTLDTLNANKSKIKAKRNLKPLLKITVARVHE